MKHVLHKRILLIVIILRNASHYLIKLMWVLQGGICLSLHVCICSPVSRLTQRKTFKTTFKSASSHRQHLQFQCYKEADIG